MAIVVGLIGGIGSGKSRVAAAFAGHGARVISGDTLGHEALDQPQIKKKVAERWGSRVLDRQGKIDRPALGTIVFADAAERKELEALVHPYIKGRLAEEIAAARANKDVNLILVDAAVMVEAGWSEHCDRILFVDAPRELRLRRLAGQRGWSPKEVEARENAQMPLDEKKARADAVLENSGTVEGLQEQVEQLLRRWGIRK